MTRDQIFTDDVQAAPPAGGLVIAAIAPHGGIAVPELCRPDQLRLAARTRAAMEEMGRRFAAARPEAIVVLTPHNIRLPGTVAVSIAAEAAGEVREDEDGPEIRLRRAIDRELAGVILSSLRLAAVPAAPLAPPRPGLPLPMDWGTLIPLWFLDPGPRPARVVIVSPATELSPQDHLRAGAAIARAAALAGRRVALVASADQGHAHDPAGPYGFHEASAEWERLVASLVEGGRLGALALIDPGLVERARADSWLQLLMLHGALGAGWRPQLLSHEVPTYFGMLCALYTRA